MAIIKKICYLCGDLLIGELDKDHTIQQQFIQGQPKKKGFDYGGTIEVHKVCNKAFGGKDGKSETYYRKAFKILDLILSKEDLTIFQRKDNPSIQILPILENDLKEFTQSDLEFFKFTKVTHLPYEEFTNEEFFKDKESFNPLDKPRNVALTVLAKSAAALIFKRFSYYPNEKWRIYALPIWGDKKIDYDSIFGNTKPFDVDLKIWTKQYLNGDWFVLYKLGKLQVFYLFLCSHNLKNVYEVQKMLASDFQIYYYEAIKLLNLVGYEWSNYVLQKTA
jgi:hypothetical protein